MNKKIEIFYLTKFIELYDKTICLMDSERPDFICRSGDNTFGIEITNLKRERISEISGLQSQIVSGAKGLATRYNLPPLEVGVWFSIDYKDYGRKVIESAKAYLFELVQSNMKKIKDGNGELVKIKVSPKTFGIDQIYVHWNEINGQKWLNDHRWKTIEPGFVSRKFYQELQMSINKKNKIYNKYRRKCSFCWLIVVIDRSKRDGLFEYSSMDHSHVYISEFEKTVLFDISMGKYYELITSKHGNCA